MSMGDSAPRQCSVLRAIAAVGGLAAACFSAAAMTHGFIGRSGNIPAISVATGILTGALLLAPRRWWLALVAGAAGGSALGAIAVGQPPGTMLMLAVLNSAQCAISAWLVLRLLRSQPRLESEKEVLVLVSAPIALVHPYVAVASAALLQGSLAPRPFYDSWRICFLSAAMGLVAVTPAVLAWWPPRPLLRRFARRAFTFEGMLLLGTLVATLVFIAGADFGSPPLHSLGLYLVFPCLMWSALRFGMQGASAASALLAIAAVRETMHGHGPFAPMQIPVTEQMVLVQGYLAVAVLSALMLAGAIVERKRAQAALAFSETVYREAIGTADAVPYRKYYDHPGFEFIGEGIERLLGVPAADFTSRHWDDAIEEIIMRGEVDGMPPAEAGRLAREGKLGTWLADCRVRAHDGTIKWIADSSYQIRDDTGRTIGSLGILQDITARVESERALRESEARLALREEYYRSLFALSPSGIVLEDTAGRIIEANPSACACLGYTREELIGRSVRDVAAASELPHIEANIARVLAGGTLNHVVLDRHRDGSERHIELRETRVTLPGGQDGILVVTNDITDQRRAQEAMRESEIRFRTMADCAPMLIWMADTAGQCVYVSRPGLQLLGVGLDEFLGDRWQTHIHPGDLARVVRRIRASYARHEYFEVEARFRRADGEYLWLLNAGMPRMLPDGSFAGFVGSCVDITARRRTEAERRANEERLARLTRYLRAVAEVNALLLQSADPRSAAGEVVRLLGEAAGASRCYWFEAHPGSRGEMLISQRAEWCSRGIVAQIGNPELQNMHAEQALPSWHATLMQGSIVQGSVGDYEEPERLIMESEDIRAILLIPMRLGGRFSGLIGFDNCAVEREWGEEEINLLQAGTDSLSHAFERANAEGQRRALEQQVLQAQKLESLGVLAGGIAHDFNNLLVGILGNAGLALMDTPPDAPAGDLLRDIETAAHRAADLTRQMLAYSGRGAFVLESIDLNSVVGELSHLLEASISKKAELRFDLAESLPAVDCDPTQIRQVVMNLIINASDALGDQPGSIRLTTRVHDCSRCDLESPYTDETLPEGRYVGLEVSDTGCGMDEGTAKRVFEPFFTTKFTGRGLGLAAVLGIVRGHHGTIRVESKLGEGSSIRVLLPACGDRLAAQQGEPSAVPAAHLNGLALVVDDEPSVRTVAQRVLQRMGMRVITAADGVEAVDLFRTHAPDLTVVILDMTMPRMGGEEALRQMRTVASPARVILSSGFTEQDAAGHFDGLNLDGFIQKPYLPADLSERVMRVLGQS
jgi:PAS domain S-box-containing protein